MKILIIGGRFVILEHEEKVLNMSNTKIRYKFTADLLKSFIETFEEDWTHTQFDAVTSNYKSSVQALSLDLPDPDAVDPRADPVTAQNILLNPKSVFRIGEQPFVLPLLEYLEAVEHQIPPDIKVLKEKGAFYLIKYGIDVKPEGKEKFTKILLHLEYPTNQGFLTYSMTPDTELEEKFSAKAKVKVGLDSHLKFRVPDIELKPGVGVGGGVEASAETNFLINLSYTPVEAKLVALGEKSSYAEWHVEKPKRMIGSVEFSTVLYVPKDTQELPLTVDGYYILERGIGWWKRDTKVEFSTPVPIIMKLIN